MALVAVASAAEPLDLPPDFSEMPPVMTQGVLAEHLPGVTARTLEDWRYRRIGPAFISDPRTRRVYYLRSDISAWFSTNRHETNTNTPTAEEAS